jgi:hypothetical protein
MDVIFMNRKPTENQAIEMGFLAQMKNFSHQDMLRNLLVS